MLTCAQSWQCVNVNLVRFTTINRALHSCMRYPIPVSTRNQRHTYPHDHDPTANHPQVADLPRRGALRGRATRDAFEVAATQRGPAVYTEGLQDGVLCD